MHMTRQKKFEGGAQMVFGSDHIHLVQKIQHEDIAISECCRGQNTSIYIINIVKIIMKTG